MDLFTPVVPKKRFHPNFKHVAFKATPEDRQVLNEWAEGFIDRDGKFVTEFQTTFNSAFWELYLFAVLKEIGISVDFSYDTPDFVIDPSELPLVIEAGSASHAATGRPEWSGTIQELKELERAPIVEEATIRLANTLTSKYAKYQQHYAALPHVLGRAFVLAIAPFQQPFFWAQNYQAMQRVLFAYDYPSVHIDPFTGEREYEHNYLWGVKKTSGAEVPLGYFRTAQMAQMSAVIFSNTATWGKVRALSRDPYPNVAFETLRLNVYGTKPTHAITPRAEYHESLLDGLHVFHNPHAQVPLPYALFAQPGVTQHSWLEQEGFPFVDQEHGAIIQRTTITVPSAKALSDIVTRDVRSAR
jgi:hypothetical protein